MANIQTLTENTQKAQIKVDKCKATIERHKKALDKKIKAVIKEIGLDLTDKTKAEIEVLREPYRGTDNSWTIYEVVNKLDDIKGAEKKLRDAEIVLGNWQVKLDKEVAKDDVISDIPQVIKDFLEQWKQMAFDWHVKRYDTYLEFKAKLYAEEKQAIAECQHLPYKQRRKYMEDKNLNNISKRLLNFAGAVVIDMARCHKEEDRLVFLNKVLDEEKKRKAIDLINRIQEVVGTIIDATGLSVNEKLNLDGIIIGTDGNAKVNTVGAGGYNIQCFHYRTLVHEVK